MHKHLSRDSGFIHVKPSQSTFKEYQQRELNSKLREIVFLLLFSASVIIKWNDLNGLCGASLLCCRSCVSLSHILWTDVEDLIRVLHKEIHSATAATKTIWAVGNLERRGRSHHNILQSPFKSEVMLSCRCLSSVLLRIYSVSPRNEFLCRSDIVIIWKRRVSFRKDLHDPFFKYSHWQHCWP